MEYPTLITTGSPWYMPYTSIRSLEEVTVHELGHQWFYGLLASNEAKWPFLDEGVNSYAELSVLRARYGAASSMSAFGISVSSENLFRVFSAARGADEPVAQEAQEFSSFQNLGALVYSRTATLLVTIERVWGRDRLERALLEYSERYRFQHPKPADFIGTIAEFVAPEAARFLESALYSRGTVDYLVRELQNTRDTPPAGFFERASGRERVSRPEPGNEPRARGRVTVYRHGSLEIPVEVRLVGVDGAEHLEHWDGHGAFRTFDYVGKTPLAYAVVDPDNKILIDDDLLNNQVALSRALPLRTAERLGYFGSVLLEALGP
jgi:hypothetical protein